MKQAVISMPESILIKARKTAKFAWRHIFTLFILAFIVRAVFSGRIQGENACGFFLGAILLDWGKQFMKPVPYCQQWWNPAVSQTSARYAAYWEKSKSLFH